MTRSEIRSILARLGGPSRLAAWLPWGKVRPSRRWAAASVATWLVVGSVIPAVAQPWIEGTVLDACGRPDYPCTAGEVSQAVAQRSENLAREAVARFLSGQQPEAIHRWLAGQPDVVDVHTDEIATRLRVRGGRGTWAYFRRGTAARSVPPPLPPGVAGQQQPAGEDDPTAPAGDNPPGEKSEKRALLIGAFSWEFDEYGRFEGKLQDGKAAYSKGIQEISELENIFELEKDQNGSYGPTDYTGRVDVFENTLQVDMVNAPGKPGWVDYEVGLQSFAGWADYDAIHVSTHGKTKCSEDGCVTSIGVGVPFELKHVGHVGLEKSFNAVPETLTQNGRPDLGEGMQWGWTVSGQPPSLEPDDSSVGPWLEQVAGPFLYVTDRYLANLYEDGLDDKVIFLNACQTGVSATSDQAPPLMATLAGTNTSVIGWDDDVDVQVGARLALDFWRDVVTERKTVAQAYTEMLETSLSMTDEEKSSNADPWMVTDYQRPHTRGVGFAGVDLTGESAVLYQTGNPDNRAVEMIRFIDPLDELPLQDGGVLTPLGFPGDGEPDVLYGFLEIGHVADDQDAAAFRLHVDVDGQRLAEDLEPEEEVRPGFWRTRVEVPLGFDIRPGASYQLDVSVDMHRGGTSRWVYDDIRFEHSYLEIRGPGYTDWRRFDLDSRSVGPMIWAGDEGFVVQHRHDDFKGDVESYRLLTVSAKTSASGTHPVTPDKLATFSVNLATDAPYPCPSSGEPKCSSAKDYARGGVLEIEEVRHKQRVGRRWRSGWVDVRYQGPVSLKPGAQAVWQVRGSLLLRSKRRFPYVG